MKMIYNRRYNPRSLFRELHVLLVHGSLEKHVKLTINIVIATKLICRVIVIRKRAAHRCILRNHRIVNIHCVILHVEREL